MSHLSAEPAHPTPAELTEQALQLAHGEGVKRDTDQAVTLLCAAARRGHAAAAYELGWLYLVGRGVTINEALASAWLREAGRLGEPPPARLMQRLAAVSATPLACIGSQGQTLDLPETYQARVRAAVHRLAPRYGLDPDLVVEVIRAESGFDPKARSPKGALGLMQLLPTTAERFGVSDPLNPLQNLRAGMAYLRWLLKRFDGDLVQTLAGYNAGEGAVRRFGGIPPYSETHAYVDKILKRYGKRKQGVPTLRVSAVSL